MIDRDDDTGSHAPVRRMLRCCKGERERSRALRLA